jgi:16S rRNA U516 pseudouridylate synthase RsuA-like enzyme
VLLTNDGERRSNASDARLGETYSVKFAAFRRAPVDKLRRGITIDGSALPCDIERMRTTGKRDDEGNSWFEVKLRKDGRAAIRKMFQAVGHPFRNSAASPSAPSPIPNSLPASGASSRTKVKMLER